MPPGISARRNFAEACLSAAAEKNLVAAIKSREDQKGCRRSWDPVVLPKPKFPEGHKDQRTKSQNRAARAALLRMALGLGSEVPEEALVVSPAQHLKNLKKVMKAFEKSNIVRIPAANAPAPTADMAPLLQSPPDREQEVPIYRKRLSDPVPLLSQFLTARVTSVEGDCLFDSILLWRVIAC